MMELHLLLLLAVPLAFLAALRKLDRRTVVLAAPLLLLPELDLLFLPRAALHTALLPAGLALLGLGFRWRSAHRPGSGTARASWALLLASMLVGLHLAFDTFGDGAALGWPAAPQTIQLRADLGVTIERQLTVREYTETGAKEYFNASLYRADVDLGPRVQPYGLKPFQGEWAFFRSPEFGAALFLLSGLGARWLLRKRFPAEGEPGS